MKCWGTNSNRELGDGSITTRNSPVNVINVANAVDMGLCAQHSTVVLSDGSVMTWGDNTFGQLGRDTGGVNANPALITTLDAPADGVEISAGHRHTCLLMNNGKVDCWGDRQSGGQLGDGSIAGFRFTHAYVSNIQCETAAPTPSPTLSPTMSPTPPTAFPTVSPTLSPTVSPTLSPTVSPTLSPTVSPTLSPTTASPTISPTKSPTIADYYTIINGTKIANAVTDTSIYRHWMVVGHYNYDNENGIVRTYYYTNETGWQRMTDISGSYFLSDRWFGIKVKMWNYYMIVSSESELFLYEKIHNFNDWLYRDKKDMSSKATYASDIAMNNDQIFVGYFIDRTVVVFEINENNDLVQVQEIVGNTNGFGHQLSVNENTLAVSSHSEHITIYNKVGSTWVYSTRFRASDYDDSDNFGTSLVLYNETFLVVGAPDRDLGTGALYTYEYDGTSWGNEQIFLSPDGNVNSLHFFGAKMDQHEGTLITTARGNENGAVFVYNIVIGTNLVYEKKLVQVPGYGDNIASYGSWFTVCVKDLFDF
jgi:hypothetical protein